MSSEFPFTTKQEVAKKLLFQNVEVIPKALLSQGILGQVVAWRPNIWLIFSQQLSDEGKGYIGKKKINPPWILGCIPEGSFGFYIGRKNECTIQLFDPLKNSANTEILHDKEAKVAAEASRRAMISQVSEETFENETQESKIFFTSDQHFNDPSIIVYCKRPFKNVEEMNEEIILKYNSLISKRDRVFFLGDTIFGLDRWKKLEEILGRLNGKKHLILGNHDTWQEPDSFKEIGFSSVHQGLLLPEEDLYLSHDPVLSLTQEAHTTCLCGHMHTLFKSLKNIVNVGVDVWNFKPVPLEMILLFKRVFLETLNV